MSQPHTAGGFRGGRQAPDRKRTRSGAVYYLLFAASDSIAASLFRFNFDFEELLAGARMLMVQNSDK
jgi:hypothetical protein